jgi:hypothetical protein
MASAQQQELIQGVIAAAQQLAKQQGRTVSDAVLCMEWDGSLQLAAQNAAVSLYPDGEAPVWAMNAELTAT